MAQHGVAVSSVQLPHQHLLHLKRHANYILRSFPRLYVLLVFVFTYILLCATRVLSCRILQREAFGSRAANLLQPWATLSPTCEVWHPKPTPSSRHPTKAAGTRSPTRVVTESSSFVIMHLSGHQLEKTLTCFLIEGIVTVLTQNGQIGLSDHELVLLYARRENDRLIARIVAKKDGVIHAKIEPTSDGNDQKEAFRALKRHVEMELDVILNHVPGARAAASNNVTASDASLEAASNQSTGPSKSVSLQGWGSLASHECSAKTESTGSRACAMPVCSPPAYSKDANETDVKKHLLGDRGWDDQ